MASSSICSLRRVLHSSSACRFSFFVRRGHVASSEGSVSSGVAAKGSAKSGAVGQEDKRADKDLKPINSWAPDPVTGYYRPINQETEAQENALKREK
ncbi:hypothetical protein V2J09_014303 [Rumex salicifolius]